MPGNSIIQRKKGGKTKHVTYVLNYSFVYHAFHPDGKHHSISSAGCTSPVFQLQHIGSRVDYLANLGMPRQPGHELGSRPPTSGSVVAVRINPLKALDDLIERAFAPDVSGIVLVRHGRLIGQWIAVVAADNVEMARVGGQDAGYPAGHSFHGDYIGTALAAVGEHGYVHAVQNAGHVKIRDSAKVLEGVVWHIVRGSPTSNIDRSALDYGWRHVQVGRTSNAACAFGPRIVPGGHENAIGMALVKLPAAM